MYKKFAFVTSILAIALVIGIAYSNYSVVNAGDEVILPFDVQVEKNDTINAAQVSPSDVIVELTNKAAQKINQSGWIHIIETSLYDIDPGNNGILDNGITIPLSYTVESWHYVNDDGLVADSFSIMKSKDGETIQTSIFTKNKTWNSTSNQDTPQGPFYLGALDYGFTIEMKDYISRFGTQPEMTKLSDSNLISFTITDKLEKPLETVDYKMLVNAVTTIATFDMETGFLTKTKRLMTFEDGSERLYYQISQKIELNVTPPEEVIKLISERE